VAIEHLKDSHIGNDGIHSDFKIKKVCVNSESTLSTVGFIAIKH